MNATATTVETVLGPVPADELGVVAVHEALLSVVPGAQYAYDLVIDRAEVFGVLRARLDAFRAAGGGTVVDASGMFHGRDLPLLEALSRTTGVHLIASTGMGPEEELGGYFLTPQTDPPTPWPAERFAELFGAEAAEGMVVPRLERRGRAGLIITAVTADGTTPTDESLLRGAARAALATGAPLAFVPGPEPLRELGLVLAEGIPADRVAVVGGGAAVAERGVWVVVATAEAAAALIDAGHGERVLLSQGAVGVSIGAPAGDVAFTDLIAAAAALPDARRVLVDNPRAFLAGKGH